MKVLFVASEVSPLAKVGGLADVAASLPRSLIAAGHDVRVIMPKYGSIDPSHLKAAKTVTTIQVRARSGVQPASILLTHLKTGVPVYLVENKPHFGADVVYGGDDLWRFLFFSRAVVEGLRHLDWQPEIVHCHDWHAALAVMWLKGSGYPCTVFTVHNLAYQGLFDQAFMDEAGLAEDWKKLPVAGAPAPSYNFMAQGILWADMVTTVSENYAREILKLEFGVGLDYMLRYRQSDLLGIVNGIDYDEYNPATDDCLAATYDASTIERRQVNKAAIQKFFRFSEDPNIPLIGMVQRIDEQKGFDILEGALPRILEATGCQLVVLGKGREQYKKMLREAAQTYRGQVAAWMKFDEPMARLIYGGCDMFLMPSRFEPCGLGQLIAMRYGALPIVRHTGGLVDTVPELSPNLSRGNGFVFQEYSADALLGAVKRAVSAYQDRPRWLAAARRVMGVDFSWEASMAKYVAAYKRVLGRL